MYLSQTGVGALGRLPAEGVLVGVSFFGLKRVLFFLVEGGGGGGMMMHHDDAS